MLSTKAPRCKFCRLRTEKVGQVLHPACIDFWIAAETARQAKKREAKRKAEAKVERAIIKTPRRALETIPDLIKKAQHAFNSYVRERDRLRGYGCISSGRPLDWSGNGVDAGHYRSVGSASHLRYNENNCHAQSKHDNQWKSGNAVDYRLGLIERIGLEAVEALEADNKPHKWQADELRAICQTYKAKLKELKEKTE